ncbi:phage holin [Aquibacillus saliphilus]|uniref:phage holin n=1 Tax=Aquibacillus saliphilus TaxID=1909422 RepID=UPI001CF01057|nr:phage holin [Aquibacillus saliphilus]
MKNNNTMVRLIVMVLVGVNSISTMYGYNLIPYTDEEINVGISAIALVVSELWNHYKNNNYSPEAKKAQAELDKAKQ